MNIWNNICGKIKSVSESEIIQPDFFFHLAVVLKEGTAISDAFQEGTATPLHIQILRRKLENYTENIWDYLNQLEVEECPHAIKIVGFQNSIAQTTYRGAGNKLLCSQSFKDKMVASLPEELDFKWDDLFTAIVSDEIPKGEAILAYRGESQTDAGIFMFETAEGISIFKEIPEFKRYIRRLKVPQE